MVKRRLPRGVYRCKGIINSDAHPDERCVLQVVGRRSDVILDRPWNGEKPSTRIVAIGAAGQLNPDELEDLFDNCIAGRNPIPETEESASGVRVVRI